MAKKLEALAAEVDDETYSSGLQGLESLHSLSRFSCSIVFFGRFFRGSLDLLRLLNFRLILRGGGTRWRLRHA